jgi:hypothetical protein
MRLSPLLSVLCLGLTAPLFAQVPKDQVPEMKNVEPKNGKIGSVLRATGLHLGKTKVEEVYLTDHTFDMMVKVLDQTDNSIQFRIPPSVKPGKLQLLVKTTGKEPVLLEEPVYVTVEEEKDTSTEVASATPSSGAAPER